MVHGERAILRKENLVFSFYCSVFRKTLPSPIEHVEINEPVPEEREPRVVGGTRRVRGMRHRAEARARQRAEENGKEFNFSYSNF